MVIRSSTALLKFYKEWLQWQISGGGRFLENCGLCANLYDFFDQDTDLAESCLEEMHEQFRTAGLDPHLPFNKDGDAYAYEKHRFACHKNPARIAWVTGRVNDQ